jgi:hypothetical protein
VHQAVLDIVKREGVAGLYSGLNSSLLGIAVTNGYHFLLNDVETSKLTGDFVIGCTTIFTSALAALSSSRGQAEKD